MIRKLLVALTMAGLVAALAPSSADAETSATVVFTAGANVCIDSNSDGDCTDEGEGPADFWAPVAPLSDCADGPDLCEPAANARYDFSTVIPGLGDQNLCVGVSSDAGADSSCELSSTGTVDDVGGVGPYCFYSSGSGTSTGDVNGTSLDVSVEWPGAAGGVLPLIFRDSSGSIVGTGAVQTAGAKPGTCGLDPRDNDEDGSGFESTNRFSVTGYATVVV